MTYDQWKLADPYGDSSEAEMMEAAWEDEQFMEWAEEYLSRIASAKP